MKKKISKYIFVLLVFLSAGLNAQMTSGKIVFERKVNLFKTFKDEGMRNWIKEENKIKIDVFELYFNDSLSVFKPQESDLKEKFGWATSKNTVYQNVNSGQLHSIRDIWGEKLPVKDTLRKREWKITDSKRNIAGYSCRKAIWNVDDTTRIYAWYSEELVTGTGPETFNGLPGTILGLATEDGGVIYFAKSVEYWKPDPEILFPKKTKDKIYTITELRTKIEKDAGKDRWGKAMLKNLALW